MIAKFEMNTHIHSQLPRHNDVRLKFKSNNFFGDYLTFKKLVCKEFGDPYLLKNFLMSLVRQILNVVQLA